MTSEEKIGHILCSEIPRELLLTFERLYLSALERASSLGKQAAQGHRGSVVGINRHFLLNEALMHALDECGIEHPELRGNAVMVGKTGIVSIGRIHMSHSTWNNSARSKAKRRLCERNRQVASLVQLDMLNPTDEPLEAITCFLVTQGDGDNENLSQIYIVVPNEEMDLANPVFKQSLNIFMQQYEEIQNVPDTAQPTLKKGVKRADEQDENENS